MWYFTQLFPAGYTIICSSKKQILFATRDWNPKMWRAWATITDIAIEFRKLLLERGGTNGRGFIGRNWVDPAFPGSFPSQPLRWGSSRRPSSFCSLASPIRFQKLLPTAQNFPSEPHSCPQPCSLKSPKMRRRAEYERKGKALPWRQRPQDKANNLAKRNRKRINQPRKPEVPLYNSSWWRWTAEGASGLSLINRGQVDKSE